MGRSDCARIGEDVGFLRAVDHADAASMDGLLLTEYQRARRTMVYEAMHFPLGFPARILSNSPRVMEAAEQSWNCFEPAFHGQTFEFIVEVKTGAGAAETLPPAPVHVVKGSLIFQIANRHNFFIIDMKRGRAVARVSQATANCARYLRYHILEGAVLCLIATMRAVPVHAACARVAGKGVLLCGDSGEGKSTLAYAGARSGWTYVSDDATYIPMYRDDRMAIGNSHRIRFRPSGVELFPELAGRPVTPRAAGKPSIEVPTSEWPEIATTRATPIDHVVFLNRRHADTHELIPLRVSAVWPWFTQHLMSPPETRPAQEAALASLLGAGLFELRYSDLGWAIERINQLAERGC
jgi:hypothetical protein